MSALKFIQLVARKKAAQKGGEGITTIANKLVAEGKVGEIAETFRLSGLTPDKWDDFIKSESDVLKYLNIIESTQKQAVKEATKTSSKGILKTTKKKEGPFPGWTPEVVEGGTRGASAIRIKQGFSTQSKLNHWSQNQQWVKDFIGRKNAEFNSLNRADQKEVLEMFETQIKKHKPKEPLAGGGIAGMLGERTGYESGRRAGPAARQRKVTDWYTDKIIADNLGRIKSDMFLKYVLPERNKRFFENITDEDTYHTYDEDSGYSGFVRGDFITKDGKRIEFPAPADKGIDVEGLLELLDKHDEGSLKDHNVEDMGPFDKRLYWDDDKGFVRGVELKGGGVAGMLGEPTFQDEDHRVPFKTGNGVYDEDTEKELFSKRVRQLMDEGFDFGEAVREAMKEGYAEGGLAGMLGE